MSIRKRGRKYAVELRPKFRAAIFASFDTKEEAMRFEAEQRILLSSGRATIKRTLSEAIDRYVKEVCPKHKGERWELIRLKKFQRSPIANCRVDRITTEDINAWIMTSKASGLKNNTIRREMGLLSGVFTQCVKWRYANHNPVSLANKPKMGAARNRRIEESEIRAVCENLKYDPDGLVKTASQAIAAAFLLAIETAMRQGEIFSLTWSNVHLSSHYVHLPSTKNGDPRDVPLSEKAEALLMQLRASTISERVFPFSQASCTQLFKRALKKAKIENLTFHDSRHEACSRLALLNGMDSVKLCKITGHRDTKSLLVYFNPRTEELVNLIRR